MPFVAYQISVSSGQCAKFHKTTTYMCLAQLAVKISEYVNHKDPYRSGWQKSKAAEQGHSGLLFRQDYGRTARQMPPLG